MKDGIIPNFIGGLGNQIFILAAAYIVHRIKNYPLYILNNPKSNNKHNKYNNNYNDTIFKYIGIHINRDLSDLKFLFSNNYKETIPQKVDFGPWNPLAIESNSLLSGYYQYYPPLDKFKIDLQELLLKGLEPIRNKINIIDNCAFLHVRRGDAHENLHIYYLLPIEYYIKCVSKLLLINKSITKIYIISDELSWVKEQKFFNKPIFEIYDNDNELETFALMTKCTAGAICGGSTFSWWGAFLGAHKFGNPVFVPQDWIKMPIYKLFPDEWNIESSDL